MIEVLKQALEALEYTDKIRNCQRINGYPLSDADKKIQKAIQAGRQAIAELESQEPVALVIDGVLVKSAIPEKFTGHLYTHPPQRTWVGSGDLEDSNAYLNTEEKNNG
jgi:hypothetical protein